MKIIRKRKKYEKNRMRMEEQTKKQKGKWDKE